MNTTQQNAVRLSRKTSTPLTITEELYLVQLESGETQGILYTKEVYESADKRLAKPGLDRDDRSAMLHNRYDGEITPEHTVTEHDELPAVVRQLITDLNSGLIKDIWGIKATGYGRWWHRVILDYGYPEAPMEPPHFQRSAK